MHNNTTNSKIVITPLREHCKWAPHACREERQGKYFGDILKKGTKHYEIVLMQDTEVRGDVKIQVVVIAAVWGGSQTASISM